MNRLAKKLLIFLYALLSILVIPSFGTTQPLPSWAPEVSRLIENGGVYVESADGTPILNLQGTTGFIPASTLKVVTALAALETLGPQYRFKTEFYLDGSNNLYVKGFGDPYIVSEELSSIVVNLKNKGLKQVNKIILDDSYFEEIRVPGISTSNNPYDALNSALSVNFNTIFIIKSKSGEIESAEPQTPITELTRTLAAKAPVGRSRINLANHPEESLLYVGYLLKAFLEQQGINTSGTIQKGILNSSAQLLYQHFSSKTLDQVLQAMLKFSTNFIANQVFLVLGAEQMGAPANLSKGKNIVTQFLKTRLGLGNFNIEEGSGISRGNSLSPQQLVKVLRAFEKYRHLLPEKLEGILAKTGTLNNVSALTGYFDSSTYREIRFAILLNQSGGYREKIARILYQYLH